MVAQTAARLCQDVLRPALQLDVLQRAGGADGREPPVCAARQSDRRLRRDQFHDPCARPAARFWRLGGGGDLYVARGKVSGGCGGINAMILVRGQPHDFDDWAAAGNPGWGYREVLPYFKKMESHPLGETPWHGGDGPMGITPMKQG